MFMGVITLDYKDRTQEDQCIEVWELSALSDVFSSGKYIICLELNFISIRIGFQCLFTPLIIKGWIILMNNDTGLIFQEGFGFGQEILVIFQDTLCKGIIIIVETLAFLRPFMSGVCTFLDLPLLLYTMAWISLLKFSLETSGRFYILT